MKHFYQTVPGWAKFTRLYRRMVFNAQDGAHFVEVGSYLGRSAAFMAVEIINSQKHIIFDCVDAWADGGPDLQAQVAVMQEPLKDQFLRNVAPVKHAINAIHKPSIEAAKDYEDGTLDFVMIDASHGYKDVVADIRAWLPKMKLGSVIAGDDFNWSGVKRAVHETFGEGRTVVEFDHLHKKRGHPLTYWSVQL